MRAYWHEAELYMTESMKQVLTNASTIEDKETAYQYITDYCNKMQNQAFDDAGQLLNQVRWYMSSNSNTMKNGRNPETGEIIDELKEIDPLVVNLDSSVYKGVPEIPEPKKEVNTNKAIIISVALLATAAITVVIFHKKSQNTN